MEKIAVLVAVVLAVATTLTAGLTVLPGSVQEAQASLCTDNFVAQFPTDQGTFGDADSNIECEVITGEIEAEQACSGNDVEQGATNEATAGDGKSDIDCEFTAGSIRLTEEP
jgi:hypothetical protein